MWRYEDPESNEADKVKYDIVRFTRGRVLDIGCGAYKAFPHFIGVDNLHHVKAFHAEFHPDVVAEAYDLSLFADGSMDSVFSSHTLEHLEDPLRALKEWWRVIKKGGYLVLYLPHKELYPNIGQHGANPDHKHDFLPDDIIGLMKQIGGTWDLVVNDKREHDHGPGSPLNEYSFLQVYEKGGAGFRESWKKPRPAKTCAIVRYGGFGDMVQVSSILPGLKAQGYHVTMITGPVGQMMLEADPHVDAFEIQDTDQVPNQELGAFFYCLRRRFDKVVNLCESIEGSLLVLPNRAQRFWPQQARHAYTDHNYLEVTHGLAEVPLPPRQKFYPKPAELEWAKKERRQMGGSLVVVYSLSGSSVHKAWPYLDHLIARLLLTYHGVRIVLVGDMASRLLERGWEQEPRVLCRSGVWSIRETLTFACTQADLVIGPETGVLNAVGLEEVPKIVTLSHSSRENLTKYWKRCIALAPAHTPCYPCHMMHYSFEDCRRDPATGTAACQADISLEQMWEACLQLLPAPIAKEA